MAIDFHMDFNPTEKFAKRKEHKRNRSKQDDDLNLLGINKVDHGAEVEKTYQESLTRYPNPNTCTNIAGVVNQWQCEQAAEQQAHQQYLNNLNSELQIASTLKKEEDTTKYLVIGGVGFITLISLLIIFR